MRNSEQLRAMFGVAPGEVFGEAEWAALIHPDDREEVLTAFADGLLKEGRLFDCSYRIVRRDGEIRWIKSLGRAERDAAGGLVSAHGAAQDITARKCAEASLEEALAKYERLVARIPAGVFKLRWRADRLPSFAYASPRFCEQLGLTVEEVMSDAHSVFRCVHEDDQAGFAVRRREAMENYHPLAWEGRLCVGEAIRWVSILSRPTRQENGEVLWDGLQTDITDRKIAETALRDSEARYRLLLQHSPVGILTYGNDFVVSYANALFAQIMEAPLDYLHGLNCRALKDSRILPAMRAALDGQLGQYEGAYSTNYSGLELSIAMSCAPVRDGFGRIAGGIAILQDITQRVRNDEELARYRDSLEELVAARTFDLVSARAEAERLAQVKSEFLANMSHEIRTPLNGVLGLAQVGYRQSHGRGKAQETFSRILASGKLLLGIINDILDFSKIEAGKLRIEAIPVDLGQVVGEALELMMERAQDKGLKLGFRWLAGPMGRGLSDPLRIGQVLLNLLSNAIKFTAAGGVKLSAGRVDGQLLLRVSDTGIGMSAEEIGKVFSPFEQADNSTTRKFGGTGLGLAITHRIVELMGGSLQVDSIVGQGSTFEVRLPWVDAPQDEGAEPDEPPRPGDQAGSRLAGLRVLVAEDNEINRIVLEDYLSSEGASAVLTGNGEEALACVAARGAEAFDVVLMDVQMPVMDGLEATRRIAVIAPGLPVIGQTAHAFDEERERCFAAGMVGHLAKPINIELMVKLILRHSAKRGAGAACKAGERLP
jgi:PAS domain S-box-containing protein